MNLYLLFLLTSSLLMVVTLFTGLAFAAFLMEWSERSALDQVKMAELASLIRENTPHRVFHRRVYIYFKQLRTLINTGIYDTTDSRMVILEQFKRRLEKSQLWIRRVLWLAPGIGSLSTLLVVIDQWDRFMFSPADYSGIKIGMAVLPLLLGFFTGAVAWIVYRKRSKWVQSDIAILEQGTVMLIDNWKANRLGGKDDDRFELVEPVVVTMGK